MRILNKIEYNVHLYVCYGITVTDLNKGKCIHIILQTDNRIVSNEALVFEMKVILHLKEIMKTKSLEVGSMQYSCKWVKEFRISSEHQKNAGWMGNHKNSLHDRKFVCSVPYTCWSYTSAVFICGLRPLPRNYRFWFWYYQEDYMMGRNFLQK